MRSESDVTGNVPDLRFPYGWRSTWFLWDRAMMSFESKGYASHHVTGLPTPEAIQDCVGHNLADVSHVGRFWEICIVRLIEEEHL